jgi:hypothetical protein
MHVWPLESSCGTGGLMLVWDGSGSHTRINASELGDRCVFRPICFVLNDLGPMQKLDVYTLDQHVAFSRLASADLLIIIVVSQQDSQLHLIIPEDSIPKVAQRPHPVVYNV